MKVANTDQISFTLYLILRYKWFAFSSSHIVIICLKVTTAKSKNF